MVIALFSTAVAAAGALAFGTIAGGAALGLFTGLAPLVLRFLELTDQQANVRVGHAVFQFTAPSSEPKP